MSQSYKVRKNNTLFHHRQSKLLFYAHVLLSTVEQVPSPKRVPPSSQTQPAPAPPAVNGDLKPVVPVTEAPPGKEGAKEEKKGGGGEGKKKGGEGEGRGKKEKKTGGGASAAVDVSRLDMRIGRITSVGRHPDADTLYVEQSKWYTQTLTLSFYYTVLGLIDDILFL